MVHVCANTAKVLPRFVRCRDTRYWQGVRYSSYLDLRSGRTCLLENGGRSTSTSDGVLNPSPFFPAAYSDRNTRAVVMKGWSKNTDYAETIPVSRRHSLDTSRGAGVRVGLGRAPMGPVPTNIWYNLGYSG